MLCDLLEPVGPELEDLLEVPAAERRGVEGAQDFVEMDDRRAADDCGAHRFVREDELDGRLRERPFRLDQAFQLSDPRAKRGVADRTRQRPAREDVSRDDALALPDESRDLDVRVLLIEEVVADDPGAVEAEVRSNERAAALSRPPRNGVASRADPDHADFSSRASQRPEFHFRDDINTKMQRTQRGPENESSR